MKEMRPSPSVTLPSLLGAPELALAGELPFLAHAANHKSTATSRKARSLSRIINLRWSKSGLRF
jgi:hypothetical protein